jgi:conjugative relaxase-like TrwC/TraI family protein
LPARGWWSAVLRFKTFGSARAAVRYYADRGADCARDEQSLNLDSEPATDASAGQAVDYYTGRGSAVGTWLGGGASGLGLSGSIHAGEAHLLERLLSGQLPDGTEVSRPVWRSDPDGQLPVAALLDAVQAAASGRGVPVESIWPDPETRKLHARLVARVQTKTDATEDARDVIAVAAAADVNPSAVFGAGQVSVALAKADQKIDVRKAGADGQVSPPKSVSLLWAFGDEHVRAQVLAAHRAAVAETVKHLETYAAHGLRGHQGDGHRAARIGTDGLIVAAFEHLTSRADDPQIHTHLVVVNLVHGSDGKWSALDTRALFRNQKTAGYLYQAVLRGELTQRLGIGWTDVHKGIAEVAALSNPKLIRAFSRRHAQIEAHLDATGGAGAKAATVACLATRPAKSHRPLGELIDEWHTRAIALIGDPRLLIRGVLGLAWSRSLTHSDADGLAQAALDVDGITAHATGFDRQELTRFLLERLPAGTAISCGETEALVDHVLAHPGVLRLIDGTRGEKRFTARGLALTEAATLALARTPTTVTARTPPTASVHALSTEQRRLVHALTGSDSSVDVVLGPAGSGKTAALHTAVQHWQQLGVPVMGLALAAVAARRLEHATGAPSTSLARLLHRIEGGQPLDAQAVVVLDEAGMVGSRDYHRLLTAITNVGGKLVAVGDRAQLTEIDAGGMFTRLAREHLRAELTDNHRQAHRWQRKALVDLRVGSVSDAIAAYDNRGHLHVSGEPAQMREHIANQYIDAYDTDNPFTVVALASTRRGVNELNAAIRERLRTSRHLRGPDMSLQHGETVSPVAVGDLVMVTRNDHRRGLLNGTRAQVTGASATALALRLEDGRDVAVPTSWAAERLSHAYAMTVHKAQGLTVDTALIDATELPDRNAGYVALSRARHRTEIHISDRDTLTEALDNDPFARRSQARPPREALRNRLEANTTLELALDQLHRNQHDRDRDEGLSRW